MTACPIRAPRRPGSRSCCDSSEPSFDAVVTTLAGARCDWRRTLACRSRPSRGSSEASRRWRRWSSWCSSARRWGMASHSGSVHTIMTAPGNVLTSRARDSRRDHASIRSRTSRRCGRTLTTVGQTRRTIDQVAKRRTTFRAGEDVVGRGVRGHALWLTEICPNSTGGGGPLPGGRAGGGPVTTDQEHARTGPSAACLSA